MAANIMTLGMNFPELIVESIIRDGIQNVQNDATIIPNVFIQLTRAYNSQKYGTGEIAKIQALVNNTPIPVVYSYFNVDAKAPCFSIMLGLDDENRGQDHLGDLHYDQIDLLVDSQKLAMLIKVDNLTPISYDANSGIVRVPDSADLSLIYFGCLYYDGSGNTFPILNGINNSAGSKSFTIARDVSPNIASQGNIRSSLNFTATEVHGVTMDVKMTIGVHTKDPLLTKYLYVLLKYFLLSRKTDMFKRGLYLTMYNGSDFARNTEYQGDQVYTRFLTMSGKVDDTWLDEPIQLIDDVILNLVPTDETQSS